MNQPMLWNLRIIEAASSVGAGWASISYAMKKGLISRPSRPLKTKTRHAGREGAERTPFVFDETYPRHPAPTREAAPTRLSFKSAPICVICGVFRGKR